MHLDSIRKAPVSVIIPCYCCADTIKRAIDSVIAQTVIPEEIILIDDFSDDQNETLATLNDLVQLYQGINIKIILLDKNSGPGSARNAGWEVASQPYLAFLDADDSWHPKKLEIQYGWMKKHPDVVLTGHQTLKLSENDAFAVLPENLIAHEIDKFSLLFSNRFPTRSVMLKSEICYHFVPEKRYAEDYLLWLTIVFNGHSAWFLEMPMAYAFKAEFGEGGLTGSLWKTQLGVVDTYSNVFTAGFISYPLYFFILGVSFLKYIRRWVITKIR